MLKFIRHDGVTGVVIRWRYGTICLMYPLVLEALRMIPVAMWCQFKYARRAAAK